MPVSNIRALFAPKNYFPQSLFPQSKQAKALTLLAISAMSYLAFDYLRARNWVRQEIKLNAARVLAYNAKNPKANLESLLRSLHFFKTPSSIPSDNQLEPTETFLPCLISKRSLESLNLSKNTVKKAFNEEVTLNGQKNTVRTYCHRFLAIFNFRKDLQKVIKKLNGSHFLDKDKYSSLTSFEAPNDLDTVANLSSNEINQEDLLGLFAFSFLRDLIKPSSSNAKNLKQLVEEFKQTLKFQYQELDTELEKRIKYCLYHLLNEELGRIHHEATVSLSTEKLPPLDYAPQLSEIEDSAQAKPFLDYIQNEGLVIGNLKDKLIPFPILKEVLSETSANTEILKAATLLEKELLQLIQVFIQASSNDDSSLKDKIFRLLNQAHLILNPSSEQHFHFSQGKAFPKNVITFPKTDLQKINQARFALRNILLTEPGKVKQYTTASETLSSDFQTLVTNASLFFVSNPATKLPVFLQSCKRNQALTQESLTKALRKFENPSLIN